MSFVISALDPLVLLLSFLSFFELADNLGSLGVVVTKSQSLFPLIAYLQVETHVSPVSRKRKSDKEPDQPMETDREASCSNIHVASLDLEEIEHMLQNDNECEPTSPEEEKYNYRLYAISVRFFIDLCIGCAKTSRHVYVIISKGLTTRLGNNCMKTVMYIFSIC